jgi:hypothetical protein
MGVLNHALKLIEYHGWKFQPFAFIRHLREKSGPTFFERRRLLLVLTFTVTRCDKLEGEPWSQRL